MYLKKLEIIGFKSFADKTVLEFSPGITAIVGPNGCGKSNVLDAVRWCLGEQSVRALRASRMEDVIFNGTDRHAPLGMTEVSIVLSNEDRLVDFDSDEIVITRRLFRSGESEYLINKQACRLKDINELLMGTGMGAAAYSIIEQGKIGMILSAKPEERRFVFDEAAGITKYKAKKKEAMRKLADTEQNLLRITDIISEVNRQLNYLERQAQKAKKYQELYSQLKEKDIILSLKKAYDIETEKGDLTGRLTKLESKEKALELQLEEKQRLSSQIREDAISIEEQLNELQEKLSVLDAERERSITQKSLSIERIGELERELGFFSKEKEEILSKIDAHKLQIQALEKEKDILKETLSRIDEEKGQVLSDIEKITVQISAVEQEKESLVQIAFDRERAISETRNRLHKIELDLNSKTNHVERINKEIEKIKEHISFLKAKQDELSNSAEEIDAQIRTQILPKIDEVRGRISSTDESIEMTKKELDELSSQVLALETQREFILHLDSKYVNLPESQSLDIWVKDSSSEPGSIVANIKGLIETKDGWSHYSIEAKILPKDLGQLDSALSDLQDRISEKQGSISELEETKNELYNDMNLFLSKETELQSQIRHLNTRIEEINGSIREYEKELEQTYEEKQQAIKELDEIKGNRKSVSDALEDVLKSASQTENELRELDIKIGSLNQQKSERQHEISQLDAKKQVLVVNIKNIEEKIESTYKAIEYEKGSANKREEIQQQTKNRIRDLKSQIETLSNRLVELDAEIGGLRKNRDEVRTRYNQIRDNVESYERAISDINKMLNGVKEESYRYELKLQEFDFKLQAIQTHLSENYSMDIDSAREAVIVPPDLNFDEVEKEIEQLRNRIKRLGQVSTIAIEEYEELKERHEFLTKQHEDLTKAKETLKDTIKQINTKSVEVFKETFVRIQDEFKRIFRMLFGGGMANIAIIDQDDVLESGIEITAKPLGKQPKSIMLLSGGEKSLTAIALIFAIFKVNPSPFCVLDEVDAALDESNVDRFVRMLQEFARRSQFLVITHNKKSIAAADAIYGVTMPTVGVSKVISVKLLGDEEPRENVNSVLERREAHIARSRTE